MIFAAIDWAEESNFVLLMNEEGQILERIRIASQVDHLSHLDFLLARRQPSQEVHVAIELHSSLLLDRLLQLGVAVYGLNPKSAQRIRERFTPTGIKDDERDAWSMAEYLRTSYQRLRPLKPDSDETKALQEWVRLREQLVQERTVQLQRLRSHLACWHPHALQAIGDLGSRWTLDLLEEFPVADTFAALKHGQVVQWCRGRRLRMLTVERIATAASRPSPTAAAARNAIHVAEVRFRVQTLRHLNRQIDEIERTLAELVACHPDAFIFQSLPNAGDVTVATMLAGFGDDRARWSSHEEVAARWGVTPITIQSGKHCRVHRRRACDTTLRQGWTWFAFNTVRREGCWAREEYQAKRQAGAAHYTVLRGVADKWVKIAYRCWMNRTPYDEQHHQRQRELRRALRMDK
jgi:transposase